MRRASPITGPWIEAALAAALRAGAAAAPVFRDAPARPAVFSVLALLLGHEVLDGGVSRETLARVLSTGGSSRHSVRPPDSPAGLLRFATGVAGQPLRWRTTGVRFRCENPFTQRFTPPAAARVPELVRDWTRASSRAWEGCAGTGDEAVPWVAYAEFFTLLKVHPFPDGNGRTARALYAARLIDRGHAAPEWLLALAMTYAGAASRFHLAAELARAGEFDDLFRNFADAASSVPRWFVNELAILEACLAAGDVAGAQTAFDSVRAVLGMLMR